MFLSKKTGIWEQIAQENNKIAKGLKENECVSLWHLAKDSDELASETGPFNR